MKFQPSDLAQAFGEMLPNLLSSGPIAFSQSVNPTRNGLVSVHEFASHARVLTARLTPRHFKKTSYF